MASDGLVSNWVYLVIATLAWNLKAWLAICWPATGRLPSPQNRVRQRRLRQRCIHTLIDEPLYDADRSSHVQRRA